MVQAWKISPGAQASHWEIFSEQGCICLGWMKLGNYHKFKTEKEILRALKRAYPHWKEGNGPGAAKSIYYFTYEIEPGDIVIASNGLSSIEGIGVVSSEYLPPKSPENPMRNVDSKWSLRNARRVDWQVVQPLDFPKRIFTQATVYRLTANRCEQIKQAYAKKYPRLKTTFNRLFEVFFANDPTGDPTRKKLLKIADKEFSEKESFEPSGIRDARERMLTSIVRRQGQPIFRAKLLAAYQGRCAITGCKVDAILEAAHIVPYKGPKTNHTANGLLLRADIHTLFDLGLVAVDEKTMRLMVSPKLKSTEYGKYHGRRISVPMEPSNRPNVNALKKHRLKHGL